MNRKELDPEASPLADFGAKLRTSRDARGWTQAHLATLTEYSAVHVSAVETGRKPPTQAFVRRLDEVFESPGRFEREWRRATASTLFEGFSEYLRSEADAVALRLFEINIIPGLLQTPAYARAYQEALVRRGASTQQQANERTALLLRRQEHMAARAPRLHMVIDEGCLRRVVGGREVMREQLRHLEGMAAQPRIILQVSPFSLGEDRPFAHPITLLTLPRGVMVGYGETQKRGFLEREPDTLAEWAGEYDQLQVEALPRAASIDFIREVRKGFDSG
ncbi:helix-turn-helix domain-containing protein [Kitasatospora sp. NBC_00240]|uniref:helix-turn-helix domain-containing protein n=1 Tax=Kitasatospora sp. NBC_00240 TaxID=2903567 RepID=UPI0022563B03|nr:helix-turn-helix transcriptional regulator [Kitasatospora sp. NBC_00240]MCX5210076.1 helix-turn-helix domain-containing protein [Kitasatospora sp. NBC_00240]